MTATDVSASAISRARREAADRGLRIDFAVAGMLDLPAGQFDAIICMDNALSHFDTQSALIHAAHQIRSRLKPGGHFVASIRDYDQLIEQRPVMQGPSFYPKRIVHQVWDWQDARRYILHLYLTLETEAGWKALHYTTTYRALLRAELNAALLAAGFTQPAWRMPQETGFYQPIVMCANS